MVSTKVIELDYTCSLSLFSCWSIIASIHAKSASFALENFAAVTKASFSFTCNVLYVGGVQPHFCPWKNVCFPIFSHGEKSIWKEREMNTFPFLSIYFSFFPMGKNGKTHIFPWAKMGLDPPICIQSIH